MPFITNLVVKSQSLKVVNELEDLEANDLQGQQLLTMAPSTTMPSTTHLNHQKKTLVNFAPNSNRGTDHQDQACHTRSKPST